LVLYARQWVGSGAAEDAVQDVFVRLIAQRIAPTNPKAWLYRAVRNAAISRVRSRRRRHGRMRDAAADRAGWFEHRPDDLVDVVVAQNAVMALPDEQREVVVLRLWCEMTLQEIAEIVGAPVSTLFSRYKAGLTAIRERLELSCRTENP
jgi:RNA polymerase sigma-70 factor (ECF subfamily)